MRGRIFPRGLISKVLDLPLLETVSSFPFFTRVVQEIPAKEFVGLPLPPDPSSVVWIGDGKKGKGGPGVSLSLPSRREEAPKLGPIEPLHPILKKRSRGL